MKRISWKRGMRLSDTIMRASDECTQEVMTHAFVLAAAGRFGLLPSRRPFELSLNIGQGFIDVDSLTCLAVTRGGDLIDAHFDSRFNNNFGTRIPIPDMPGVEEYILTVNAMPGQWNDVPEGFEEPVYAFALVQPDTTLPDNAMPIARIVEDHGWRMDDADFVPPCLFVASHWKYEDQLRRFADVLAQLDAKTRAALNAGSRDIIALFWPTVQQLRITADKEREFLTPMTLLADVQRCVCAFTCAADIHDALEVADAKMFHSYVLAPYNYKEAYQRIEVGLKLCVAISEKVEKLAERTPPRPEPQPQQQPQPRKPRPMMAEPSRPDAPMLAEASSTIDCKDPNTNLRVIHSNRAANIFFTTDGTEPTQRSPKATKSSSGFKISFKNGFNGGAAEDDRPMLIKMIAIVGGVCSDTAEFDIVLHKNLKGWSGITI